MPKELPQAWKRAGVELLIVVLGVLIALAVDSWRETMSLRQVERQYLESLVQDLEQDLAEFEVATERSYRNEHSARWVLELLSRPDPSVSPDSLAINLETAGFFYVSAISPHTFKDLTSTGNLQIILNRRLRRELGGYYNLVESQAQWHPRYRHIQEVYTDLIQGTLGPDIRDRIVTYQTVAATDADRSRILAEMNRRPGLEAALEGMIWIQVRARREHESLREAASNLRESVRLELGPQ